VGVIEHLQLALAREEVNRDGEQPAPAQGTRGQEISIRKSPGHRYVFAFSGPVSGPAMPAVGASSRTHSSTFFARCASRNIARTVAHTLSAVLLLRGRRFPVASMLKPCRAFSSSAQTRRFRCVRMVAASADAEGFRFCLVLPHDRPPRGAPASSRA